MREITIAGGGLAGLSLGIALRRRGVPVVLHEAGAYPRHRVCGEFISGVAGGALEELGVSELLGDARRLLGTEWFRGGRQIFSAELPSAALGISRWRLDARLAEAFRAAGGELHQRSRQRPGEGEGEVWTAGRRVHREGRWLGLKLHLRGLGAAADLEMHLGEHCYVGLAKVEDGVTNVCGLFRRRDVAGRGPGLLFAYLEAAGLGELAGRLRAAEVDGGSFLGVGSFRLGRQRGGRGGRGAGDGSCAIGDAAQMIPPFTGNGMSMAFESARAALDPLCDYCAGGIGWGAAVAAVERELAGRFRRRLLVARALHPLLLSRGGGSLLALAARGGLLPFATVFRLLR